MKNLYLLVEWPNVQEYMDEPWFDEEARLSDESSYFIPLDRIPKEKIFEHMNNNIQVTECCWSPNFSYLALINDYKEEIDYIPKGKVLCGECGSKCKRIDMPVFEPTYANKDGDSLQKVKDHVRIKFSNNNLPTKLLEVHHCDDNGPYVEFNSQEIYLNKFTLIKK